MINDKSLGGEAFTDFSGFESMRTAARKNDPQAVHKVAKQLEGVFLNMMLSSMREANQLFNEDSLMSSKDVKFYEQMLDQQLSVTLTQGKGIGLADQITKQIAAIQGRTYDPESGSVPNFQNTENPREESKPANLSDLNYDIYKARVVPRSISKDVNQVQDVIDSEKIDKSSIIPDVIASSNVTTSQTADFQAISPQDFVEKIVPFAKKAATKLGVPVEAVVAQAALETGWGRYMMKNEAGTPALNFFGIKADKQWAGNNVKVPTIEYRNGIAAKENATFRSYGSLDEAFSDYSNFLSQKPRYQGALQAIRDSKDAKSWGNELQAAGYATDPNYGKKIASIVSRLQKDDAFQQTLTSDINASR